MDITFGHARDTYAHRASLKSAHTLNAYLRSVGLFLEYLGDRGFTPRLPIQSRAAITAEEIQVGRLTSEDEFVFSRFAAWMQTSDPAHKRPYAPATIELRLAGVQHFFEFMQDQGWLPGSFSLENAIRAYKNTQQERPHAEKKVVETYQDLSELIAYYDTQQPPKRIQQNPQSLQRWKLTRLRNCALIKTLAETGGQISAILSINVSALENAKGEMIIEVTGKSAHTYPIHLKTALPAIRDYLRQRAVPPEKADQTPVFVSHDARYEGHRMSRIIAWRIIQRAAKAVGLPDISPHDLRHWCAHQMIESGVSLEEVKNRLGHRSMHTIRTYYGHWIEEKDQGAESAP